MKPKIHIRRSNHQQKSQLKVIVFSIILLMLFLSMYVLKGFKPSVKINSKPEISVGRHGNDFNLKGAVSFFGEGGDSITSIYVEIADNNREREKGLMYRENIPDTVGMLFIYQDIDYRSFWMRNTPSSLDIMYADSLNRIVSMYDNTQPYSEELLPSGDKAQYVIEAKAGFCARYGIRKNDFFRYKKMKYD